MNKLCWVIKSVITIVSTWQGVLSLKHSLCAVFRLRNFMKKVALTTKTVDLILHAQHTDSSGFSPKQRGGGLGKPAV